MANPKRPKDANQRAKLIVEIATGEREEIDPNRGKNGHAVELGRLGGLKGGKARAEKLTKKERVSIARNAAKKRWDK
jgi:hypothetical protein